MRKLEKVLSSMLKENTGEHFLDSGGAYGRHWQENQKIDFEKMPRYTIEDGGDGYAPVITISLYHFLKANLGITEQSELLNASFKKYRNKKENANVPDLALMEEWTEKITGTVSKAFNSYNWESPLSQVIQGICFEALKTQFVILQIHGGADVRGGYTAPQVFEIEDEYLIDTDIRVFFTDGTSIYSDDGGNHYYSNETSGDIEFIYRNKKLYVNGKEKTIQTVLGGGMYE